MSSFKSEKINLHTHTCFCDHAAGSVDDYVRSAAEAGLEVLGFTEHAPVPGDPISCNMMMRDLPSYVKAVREAGEKTSLHVLLGAECDFEPLLANFYREELLGRYGFDYLICSVHLYFDHEERGMRFVSQSKDFTKYLSAYAAKYCAALETGIFLFGCHADLFRASYLPWDENARAAAKDIIQCAASLGIPLEINEAGLHKPVVNAPEGPRCPYSTDEFFSMARDAGLKLILSSDGHRPEDAARNTLGREMASRLKIKPAGCAIGPDGKLSII